MSEPQIVRLRKHFTFDGSNWWPIGQRLAAMLIGRRQAKRLLMCPGCLGFGYVNQPVIDPVRKRRGTMIRECRLCHMAGAFKRRDIEES